MRIAVASVLLCVLADAARASEASSSTEELIGWSADGETWATIFIDHGNDPSEPQVVELRVHRRDNVELTVTMPDVEAARRVGLRSQQLARFGLEPVAASWRTVFRERFAIRTGERGWVDQGFWPGAVCHRRWSVHARDDDREAHRFTSTCKDDICNCSTVRGGYARPGGPHALVKHTTYDAFDRCCTATTRFTFVEVPRERKGVQPQGVDPTPAANPR